MKRILSGMALVAMAACGGDSNGPPMLPGGGSPGANEVWMQSTAFTPVSRSVTAGTVVSWTNKDGITHTVNTSTVPAGASAVVSGNIAGNGTFTTTLTIPGTYEYYCSIHGGPGSGMHATIVVN